MIKTKELVSGGHALVKELHCAESAALVRELATQLDVQLARSNALAAENAGLYKFIKADCWVWDDKNEEYIDAVDCMPETPATDAFLAEVRAQGVEMFAAHKRERQQALRSRSMRMSEEAAGMAADAENFADELRKGVQS